MRKFIPIVLIICGILIGLFFWSPNQSPSSDTVSEEEVSKEEALQVANDIVVKGCDFQHEEVKKVNWYPEGPAASTLRKEICPGVANYQKKKVWKAENNLNENIIAVSLIGVKAETQEGLLRCGYAQDKRAAPGIMPLVEGCRLEK